MSRQGRTGPFTKRQVASYRLFLTGGIALCALLAAAVRVLRLRATRAWQIADDAVLRTLPAVASRACENAAVPLPSPAVTIASHGVLRLIGYVAALGCGVLAQMQAAQGAQVAVPLFAVGGALLAACSFRIPLGVPLTYSALGKEPVRARYRTSTTIRGRRVQLAIALAVLVAAIIACVLAAGDTAVSLSAQPLVLYFTSIGLLVLGAVLLDRGSSFLPRHMPHLFARTDMLPLLIVAALAVFFRFHELNHIPWYIEDDESSRGR